MEGGHRGPVQGVEPKWGKEGNYTELYGSNSKSGYIKGNDQIIVLGWESGSSEKGVTNMQRETDKESYGVGLEPEGSI